MEFRFRHFSILQSNSALKVGTDAMVLGALCDFPVGGKLLDIGTGSGVLAMILAQRFQPEAIVALEPDGESCLDAAENFSNCPFPVAPVLEMTTVQEYPGERKFSGIVSNPPYFIDSTKNGQKEKAAARHQTDLTIAELFQHVNRLLSESGIFWLILPFDQLDSAISGGSKHELFPKNAITVYGKPKKPVRVVLSFIRTKETLSNSSLTIRTEEGKYTNEYIALTKDLHGADLQKAL